MNIDDFKNSIYEGMKFDKVRTSSEILKIKENGFSYSIGEVSNSKIVSFEEIEICLGEIDKNGFIDRFNYKLLFPKISASKPCNFTAIGGVLQQLKYVRYSDNKYCKLVE